MNASSVTMRRATVSDLPAIVAMLADDEKGRVREDASLPLYAGYVAAFEAIDRDANQLLVIAEIETEIVGTLQLSFLPGISFRGAWRGQIEAVRIASDVRNLGLGTAMIDWAVDQCRKRGCRMVQLTSHRTRTDAHRFYEKLGWERSHTGFKLHLETSA